MALDFVYEQKCLLIKLDGKVKNYDYLHQRDTILRKLKNIQKVSFDAVKLSDWDSSLAAFLYQIVLEAKKNKIEIDWNGLPNNLRQLLKLALIVDRKPAHKQLEKMDFWEIIGDRYLNIYNAILNVLYFLGNVLAAFGRLFSRNIVMRKVDFEFAFEECGYKAVGIVSLVSFMVGLILAFVGVIQLKMFGAQIYVASLVAIAMTRIMGAIMVGIIMAGRTGASYAATIGTMQVNEEVDALKTFGFNVVDFLVIPRILSLIIAMPFLTMLADIVGMIGGAFVAVLMLNISPIQYWNYSIEAFGLANFLVGIFHGLIYGFIISCCGCFYGINCGRSADGVGVATTKVVVSAIVIMIVVTGVLTMICEVLGI